MPTLLDIQLRGSVEEPFFYPQEVHLHENEFYLLVIENGFDYPYLLVANQFAEAIVTQSIQGSPSVTQQSVALSPHSKVQWLLRTKKAGKFPFYAHSTQLQKVKSPISVFFIGSEESKSNPESTPPSVDATQSHSVAHFLSSNPFEINQETQKSGSPTPRMRNSGHLRD
ncbi:MAG TPA: hypothetical protein VFP93_01680 [Gammaproteobacteria bacterium]|nr:hypothetical protein [Gammaproteobacteria bacterium]